MSDGSNPGAGAGGEGGAADGGAGSASPGASAGGAAAILTGGDGGQGGGDGGQGGGGGGDPWYAGLPDEDRAWAENKKYADIGTTVRSFRELEARFLSGDKLVVPKEGDAPEVFERFYASIGRPEKPEDYAIAAPEGHELDADLAARISAKAHAAGVPKGMLQPLADEFNAYVLEQVQAAEAKRAADREAGMAEVRREWGDNFSSRVAEANRAMRMLEFSSDDIGALEDSLGTKRVMQLMHKLGAGMGEDAFSGGGAAMKFSLSPAEAKAELDKIETDPAKIKAYREGDKALRERAGMLRQIIAQDEERRRAG